MSSGSIKSSRKTFSKTSVYKDAKILPKSVAQAKAQTNRRKSIINKVIKIDPITMQFDNDVLENNFREKLLAAGRKVRVLNIYATCFFLASSAIVLIAQELPITGAFVGIHSIVTASLCYIYRKDMKRQALYCWVMYVLLFVAALLSGFQKIKVSNSSATDSNSSIVATSPTAGFPSLEMTLEKHLAALLLILFMSEISPMTFYSYFPIHSAFYVTYCVFATQFTNETCESNMVLVILLSFAYYFLVVPQKREVELQQRREYRLNQRLLTENLVREEEAKDLEIFAKGARETMSSSMAFEYINAGELKFGEELGSGAFGKVKKGVWRGTSVAIKECTVRLDKNGMLQFGKEAAMMMRLRHPRLVTLLGFCPSPLILVLELCSNGALYTLVRAQKLDFVLYLRMMHDISSGMAYLHSQGVVHRDLKTLNILLNGNWQCKVSDFGLSKSIFQKGQMIDEQDEQEEQEPPKEGEEEKPSAEGESLDRREEEDFDISICYAAPEVLLQEQVTEAADVYAWAICAWECLTGATPYSTMTEHAVRYMVVEEDRRPIKVSNLSGADIAGAMGINKKDYLLIESLIKKCWVREPSDRPSFNTILTEVEKIGHETTLDPDWLFSDTIQVPERITKVLKFEMIKMSDLKMGNQLGKGAFGSVFTASYQGTKIAVKQLDVKGFNQESMNEFFKELSLLKTLRHPNITLFMGASVDPPQLILAMELLEGGSVYDLYHKAPRYSIGSIQHILLACNIALDMCKGMAYLHARNPPIIHRDLKSQNILLTKHMEGKIADFGLSRVKDETKAMTRCGSPMWAAPEILRGEKFNESCDVFSFHVIFLEMLSWDEPYPGLGSNEIMRRVALEKFRMETPHFVGPDLEDLINQASADDPEHRAKFTDVMPILEQFISAQSKGGDEYD